MHGRGRAPALGAPGALWRRTGRCSRSTRPATRRSAPASPANLSGPLRHRFGALRDLVLGVTLVLADGTVANAGGKVVKNVAGYDLGKLVCGSRGRLGADRTRRAAAPPASRRRRATLVVGDGRRARRGAALTRSQLQPSALDVLPRARRRALRGRRGGGRGSGATRRRRCRRRPSRRASGPRRARQGAARGRVRFAPGAPRRGLPARRRDRAPGRRRGVRAARDRADTPAAVHALERARPRAQFDPGRDSPS